MSEEYLIVELTEGEATGRGKYLFKQIPRVGEQISLHFDHHFRALYVIESIQHYPVCANPDTVAGEWAKETGPFVMVFIRYVCPHD